jgi:hypothetical protein
MGGFVKVFDGDGSTFGAMYEAEKWLRDNGYSVGPSCVSGPQGVVKGDAYISKWYNMTKREQSNMDGTLQAGRDCPAKLILKQPPVN